MRTLRVSDWRAGLKAGLAQEKRLGALVLLDDTKIECATDGHAIALVDAGRSSTMPLFGESAAKVCKTACELWSTPHPASVMTMALRHLLDAAGKADRPHLEECPDCYGTGRHADADAGCKCTRCDCDYCGGDAKIERVPSPRKRMVPGFRTRFDANLLALVLGCIDGLDPDEPVSLFDLDPTLCAIMATGEGWRVVVMGRLHDESEEYEPLFPEKEQAAS